MVLSTIQIIQKGQNTNICNELMVTNKSGCCEHLDVGCNQGIILYLDPPTPPHHKEIPEILIDNCWAVYASVSITHLYHFRSKF